VISTPTDVLRTHRHLYEVLASPNPNVVRFYDDFFSQVTERALASDISMQVAWLAMFHPATSGSQFLQMLRRPLYAAPSYQVAAGIVGDVTAMYERSTQEARLREADLPSPTGFIWLDEPVFLTDASGARIGTRAFSWGPQPESGGGLDLGDGTRLTSWCLADDTDDFTDQVAAEMLVSYDMRLSLSHSQFVPFGTTLRGHDRARDVTPDDVVRWIHTLWMFMGTEIVSTSPAPVARPERKRSRLALGADTVNVVLLRRIHHGDHEVGHRDIDWSCRWVVQAHYRHLEDYAGPHPLGAVPLDGDKDHCAVCGRRITRVRACVKGPDGLPLKAVPETIYRVAR
jgi:hypothetical protein